MKYLILMIGFIGMILISCNKKSNDKLTDKIIYLDFFPDLILHPVYSVGFHSSGLCQEAIPFPSDSLITVDIDINQDGNNDFRFSYSTSYEWVSASNPCANYNSVLEVRGLSAGNKIKVANDNMYEVSVLENGDVLNPNEQFANKAIIYHDNSVSFLYFDGFSGEGFIGFQLSRGELGWIKLDFQKDLFRCKIMEYGYNETVHSQIRIGER